MMTEERLSLLEDRNIRWGYLEQPDVKELIAEIRRCWKERDAHDEIDRQRRCGEFAKQQHGDDDE